MGAFPDGPGVAQAGGAGRMKMMDVHTAVVANEPESDGPSAFARPQPTDEGGSDSGGFVKTADYYDGYYGASGDRWQQV